MSVVLVFSPTHCFRYCENRQLLLLNSLMDLQIQASAQPQLHHSITPLRVDHHLLIGNASIYEFL